MQPEKLISKWDKYCYKTKKTLVNENFKKISSEGGGGGGGEQ